MRPTLENLIALATLLGTEAWLLDGIFSGKPEFEPAIAFVAAFGVIFAKDPVKRHFGWGQNGTEHDRLLFTRFQVLLPADSVIKFIRQQDFGDSFIKARIDPVIEFVETWDNVETEFLDSRIQKRKTEFYGVAEKFTHELALRTVPTRNTGFISVYPDSMRELGQGRSQSVLDDAKILNELAKEVVEKYESFVRYSRSRIAL